MLLSKPFRRWLARTIGGTRAPAARRRGGAHPRLERLEDRSVPSSFTAASVSGLVADINAANATGGSNTITLVAGKTFTITAVDNTTDGATGLPVIASGDNLTIVGNGDVIQRSTADGTPAFRLFDVASGASVALANLTLQGGLSGQGGAIYSQGSLNLNGVTVQNNVARSSADRASNAWGGGISIQGTVLYGVVTPVSLTMQDCTISGNQAVGTDAKFDEGGGSGLGGGLYVGFGCSASLTSVTLSSNTAQGGQGRGSVNIGIFKGDKTKVYNSSGGGLGGGLYVVYDASAELHSCVVTGNSAIGGAKNSAGTPGDGIGGGLYLEPAQGLPGGSVCLDAFTVAHVNNNKASTSYPDIYGSYTTC
jgi:hypothetical protein